MSLEDATDSLTLTAVGLAVGGANYDLHSVLKRDAICGFSIAPVPIIAMERARLPWLNVWRAQSVDTSESQHVYEQRVTLRIDYYCEPTPHGKRFDRWDVLSATWGAVYRTLKLGYHPNVANGQHALYDIACASYVDGSARVRYLFAADGASELTYPSFQGQMDFTVQEELPAGQTQPLADFLRMYVDFKDISNAQDPDANDENQILVNSIIGTPTP